MTNSLEFQKTDKDFEALLNQFKGSQGVEGPIALNEGLNFYSNLASFFS